MVTPMLSPMRRHLEQPTPWTRRGSVATIFCCVFAVSAQAHAQSDEDRPNWQRNFDEVTVKRVRPGDLPTADESALPAALAKRSALPRPVELETLRTTSAKVAPLVLEVIVVPRQQSVLQQSSIVVRGEAAWISANEDGSAPHLVTNALYLTDAEHVFVRPAQTAAQREGAIPHAARTDVRKMTLGSEVRALLKDPSLIAVEVIAPDKHRNLAVLWSDDARFVRPATGLTLFPVDDEATSSVFGFSHTVGSTLVVTTFLAPSDRREELAYYLHCSFPAILGAPLIDATGRVVAVTAMRHPDTPERTLVIPPRALRHYLVALTADGTDEDDATADRR